MKTDLRRGAHPARTVDIELSRPLPGLSARATHMTAGYQRALCLIRLHDVPLGVVGLEFAASESAVNGDRGEPLATGMLEPAEVASRIWASLAPQISRHLATDGLPVPDSLPPEGLAGSIDTPCHDERDAVTAAARPMSIVVGTRERTDRLRTCLRSLLELDYPDYEIVVVDNAPTSDQTRQLLNGGEFTNVSYLREDRPGLAAAHNRGLANVSGEIVAFTDDDVIADRHWLVELARGFGLAERVACVTGLIMPAELDTPAQIVAERLWGFNKGFSERVFDGTTHGGDRLYPYAAGKFGSGANMAFDTAALRARGGFDPRIGIGTPARGGDDLSAFFTVIASGNRLVYNPAALVRHHHHAQYGALRRQAFNYGVGLTAYLAKTVVDEPVRLVELARLGRMGFRRALDPRPSADSRAEREWPPDLARMERLGMLQGPFAYLYSRLRGRMAYGRQGGVDSAS